MEIDEKNKIHLHSVRRIELTCWRIWTWHAIVLWRRILIRLWSESSVRFVCLVELKWNDTFASVWCIVAVADSIAVERVALSVLSMDVVVVIVQCARTLQLFALWIHPRRDFTRIRALGKPRWRRLIAESRTFECLHKQNKSKINREI